MLPRHLTNGMDSYHGSYIYCLLPSVSEKLEEGDFKGAVHFVCSEDSIADRSDATFAAFKEKHPPPHPDSSIPSPPGRSVPLLTVSVEDVAQGHQVFSERFCWGP